MKRRNLSCAVVLITFCCAALAEQPTRRAITPEDAYSLVGLSDPHISMDGNSVAYVLSTVDRKRNKRVSSIWIVPVDGAEKPKQFVAKTPARYPRWSPDGKWLAYISAAEISPDSANAGSQSKLANTPAKKSGPKAQVWLVSRDGTAPRQITDFQSGVSAFDWSPDSNRLVVVAKTAGEEQSGNHSDVRHYTSMVYKRNGVGWFDHDDGHLWVVPLSSGKAQQITFGKDLEDSDPKWSPNGKSIAYVEENRGDNLRQTLDVTEILTVPADGGNPRRISQQDVEAQKPAWSPNSQLIAYAAARSTSEMSLLWIADASGNHPARLASDADLFPTEVHWTSDGALWFGAANHGTASFYRIAPGSAHAALAVGGERALHEASFSVKTGKVVFLANDPLHPPELFAASLQDQGEHQLTFHNQALLAQLDLQTVETLNFRGADGLPIQGFFMKPLGWHPGGHYPMILAIHGGPSGMFGEMWEMDLQLYAAQGWAVLFCNPRGSSGYGMKFQRDVAGQWGGQPYEDLMDGVDFALAKYSWIDRNRLGVVGWSYGGFMTDWIITQTHRFKAAISIAGISDLISVEGTRDFAYGHSRDFDGDVFTHFDLYRKYSAIFHANNVTTPTLFLQGDADYRVPESQSEEYFRALKHFGVPAELVLFPRENHMLPVAAEPRHLVESYQWRLYWFKRYLANSSSNIEPD